MMASDPSISVVIPLYNKRDYIERCLRSVRAQTFTDYEIVVVNDGSTDGSEELAKPFLKGDDLLINQENTSVGAVGGTRNRGFAEASANLIASLDADDKWLPRHLADIYEMSEQFPEAGFYGTGIRTYRSRFFQDRHLVGKEPRLVNYFRISAIAGACNSSSVASRKEIFEELGGRLADEPVGSDLEYWARIALLWPMALHPAVSTVIYREASTAKSRSAAADKCGPDLACETLEKALDKSDVPEDLEDDVRAYISAGRIQRAKFLLRQGRLKAAADLLHQDEVSAGADASLHFLKASTRIGGWLPEGSRSAVFLGRIILGCMISPKRLAFALLGIPRREGELVFKEGFAGRTESQKPQ